MDTASSVDNSLWEASELLVKLKTEKKAGNELQMRKHADWNDNYELYRSRVKTNRLTQRQPVNIPLMKETLKTILSKVDEPVAVDWMELSGDEDKEILYQEIWDMQFQDQKFELTDILDKKNVLLYGISTRKLNLANEGVTIDTLDPYDIIFDPLMRVGDIESARFIIHQNIFRSLREILADKRYETDGKEKLKMWVDSPAGITQAGVNKIKFEQKMERIKSMGVKSSDFALFAGGDRLLNLSEHYTNQWDNTLLDWERRVVTYADDSVILLNKPLKELIGITMWPFITWTEDPETTDVYSDSVADIVRTPNKVLNVWISQLVENRTLKNFQMHWFSPVKGYTPQTYSPGPGVMLPAPPGDDINKVIKPVEISGLDDTFTAIQMLTQIVERATGATAIEKGEPEKGDQTLGEVKVLVAKAFERTRGMAKFYRMAWYETAMKWDAMMQANAPAVISLYKRSRNGKMYMKKVYASDWQSSEGYKPIIGSSSEHEAEKVSGIQKFAFLLQQFPNNLALRKIAQKRMLETVDLTPEELKAVESAEESAAVTAANPQEQTMGQSGGGMEDIASKMQELTSLATPR